MKPQVETPREVEQFRAKIEKGQEIYDESAELLGHKDSNHEADLAELEYREAVNGLIEAGFEPLQDESVEYHQHEYEQERKLKHMFSSWAAGMGKFAEYASVIVATLIFALFVTLPLSAASSGGEDIDLPGLLAILFSAGWIVSVIMFCIHRDRGYWNQNSFSNYGDEIPADIIALGLKVYHILHPEPAKGEEDDRPKPDNSIGLHYHVLQRYRRNVFLSIDLPKGRKVYIKHWEGLQLPGRKSQRVCYGGF